MNKNRVIKIVPFFPPSGYAGGIENLAKGWSKTLICEYGYNIRVLTSKVLGERISISYKNKIQERYSSLIIKRTAAFILLTRPIMPFLAAKCLLEIKEFQPQIAHIYIPLAQDLLIAKVFKKSRIPLVITYAADPVLDRNINYFTKKIEKIYNHMLISTLELADYVVSTSQWYIRISPILRAISRKKIEVVYQGVDTRYFRPPTIEERKEIKKYLSEKYHISNKMPIIGFVGRLVPYKGLNHLLAAAKELKQFNFLIVGNGPLRKTLESKATENVLFLGRVSNEMLRKLYWAFDVTVNPSISRTESIPLTMLESMACGTPVIVTDVGGNREIFDNASHKFGILIQPEDEQLISAIIEALDKREYLSKGARLEAIKYDWKNVTKALHEIYQELI
jgi:glycosyltransferase involved in cell wall biosynthesis